MHGQKTLLRAKYAYGVQFVLCLGQEPWIPLSSKSIMLWVLNKHSDLPPQHLFYKICKSHISLPSSVLAQEPTGYESNRSLQYKPWKNTHPKARLVPNWVPLVVLSDNIEILPMASVNSVLALAFCKCIDTYGWWDTYLCKESYGHRTLGETCRRFLVLIILDLIWMQSRLLTYAYFTLS